MPYCCLADDSFGCLFPLNPVKIQGSALEYVPIFLFNAVLLLLFSVSVCITTMLENTTQPHTLVQAILRVLLNQNRLK